MSLDVTFDEGWRKRSGGGDKGVLTWAAHIRGHGGAQSSLSEYRRHHHTAGILVVLT